MKRSSSSASLKSLTPEAYQNDQFQQFDITSVDQQLETIDKVLQFEEGKYVEPFKYIEFHIEPNYVYKNVQQSHFMQNYTQNTQSQQLELVSGDIPDTIETKQDKQLDPRGKRNQVEQLLKKILRAFRQDLRYQFYAEQGENLKQANRKLVERNVQKFFTMKSQESEHFDTRQNFEFDEEFYNKHEETLLSLIRQQHQGKSKDSSSEQLSDFSSVLKDVLSQKPNKKNLIEFFKNESIKALWFGSNINCNRMKKGYKDSQQLKDILRYSNSDTRTKLIKLFQKVAPAECVVLPEI